MKLSTTIKLADNLELEIEGNYYPGEPMIWTLPNGDPGHPGSASEFEIHDIKITKGSLLDLIDYSNRNLDLWEHFTEICIQKIEEDERL